MRPDIKGLTKLAQVLRRVPRSQFNMEHWWEKSSCGTNGCIAGWAAQMFPHRFKKVIDDGYLDYNNTGSIRYEIVHRHTGLKGEEAIAQGFHLSMDDATNLTNLTMEDFHIKRTPKQAAKTIMALVGRLKRQIK